MIDKTMPIIMERITDTKLMEDALKAKTTRLQALIIANRNLPDGTDINNFLNPSLSNIPDISKLKDIQKAGNRIADAVITGEQICLACDFDVDGISSAAVLFKSLCELFGVPNYKIDICISNRMKDSYGFSDPVVERILKKDPIPSLVITADQGSSNCSQVTKYIEGTRLIASIKENKKKKEKRRISVVGDVIISDHHEIPKIGGPINAYAFVNPQRKDDTFPDKAICGCTVAMFLMAATRAALIKKGHLDKNSDTIMPLMAYSTAATISDCVSMASGLNRAIVKKGLEDINNETIPAWKAMKKLITEKSDKPINAESIAFGLGPMINACSRTGGDGLNAVRYYLADNDWDAERYLSFLKTDNEDRKDIEKRLVKESMKIAKTLIEKNHKCLVIALKNGHHGVHGIAASRLTERFGRPTIILSPKETIEKQISIEEIKESYNINIEMNNVKKFYDIPKTLNYITYREEGEKFHKVKIFYLKTIISMSGSGRSIDGLGSEHKKQLNLLACLIEAEEMCKKETGEPLFIGFGGHHMAAGMNLSIQNISKLSKYMEIAVGKQISIEELYPRVWSDGAIPSNYEINNEFIEEIEKLEPFGRQFDYPAFTISAKVLANEKLCGKNKDVGRLKVLFNNIEYSAIWFKAINHPFFKNIKVGDSYCFVIEPKFNYFRGTRSVQFFINHAENINREK